MNLNELAIEYKNQAEIIERKINRLRKERKHTKGENLYTLNKKISELENMHLECICLYNELNRYYDK